MTVRRRTRKKIARRRKEIDSGTHSTTIPFIAAA
jgi:hypothetical protein